MVFWGGGRPRQQDAGRERGKRDIRKKKKIVFWGGQSKKARKVTEELGPTKATFDEQKKKRVPKKEGEG